MFANDVNSFLAQTFPFILQRLPESMGPFSRLLRAATCCVFFPSTEQNSLDLYSLPFH